MKARGWCGWPPMSSPAPSASFPPRSARPRSGVPVRFEASPSPDLLAEGFEADILGLFSGAPHGSMETDPPQIYLYTANLWDFAQEDDSAFRRRCASPTSTSWATTWAGTRTSSRPGALTKGTGFEQRQELAPIGAFQVAITLF